MKRARKIRRTFLSPDDDDEMRCSGDGVRALFIFLAFGSAAFDMAGLTSHPL
jgi:hypothetical protein